MTRYKSIIGALVLCALSICAFGAASASAAGTGLTAVECKKEGPAHKYNTAECLTPGTTGEFETVPNALNTAVPVEGNSTTPAHALGSTATTVVSIFHSTIGGVEVTVTCGTGTTTGGTLTNETPGGAGTEMVIHGEKGVTTWTECHASPRTKPNKKCFVQGTAPATAQGTVKTNPLTTITKVVAGPPEKHRVTITPEKIGGVTPPFTTFNILTTGDGTEACFLAAVASVSVTGEAVGRVNTETHSHLTLDEASNLEGSLKANGATASQTETVQGKNPNTGNLIGAETF